MLVMIFSVFLFLIIGAKYMKTKKQKNYFLYVFVFIIILFILQGIWYYFLWT